MDALVKVTAVAATAGLVEIKDRPTIKLVTNNFINTVDASTGKTPKTPEMTGPAT